MNFLLNSYKKYNMYIGDRQQDVDFQRYIEYDAFKIKLIIIATGYEFIYAGDRKSTRLNSSHL